MIASRSMQERDATKNERPVASSDATLSLRASPYPVSRLAPKFELVDLAKEIEQADATLALTANAKLQMIAEQMAALREQAKRVLEEAKNAADLHRARCSFKKRPGALYHLYRRGDFDRYFSMLSPDEWGEEPPHAYEGTYRLEPDMAWTRVDG